MYGNICFVASPIGEPGTAARDRADGVFANIIRPAVEQLGLQPLRADHIERPGLISVQMLNYLVHCPLVIADATGNNPNVLYEIGVRHAIGKPLVQLAERGSDLPFDIESIRRIEFDSTEPDTFEDTRRRITGQVELLLANEDAASFSLHAEVGLDYQTVDELLREAAISLRNTFRTASSSRRDRAGKLDDMRFLIDFIRRINPDNGHGHYFAGELALLEGDRDQMRREFFKYLDRADADGTTMVNADTSQEICYRFPQGYCRQRSGWVCHLLATTFMEDLDASTSAEQIALYSQRVTGYCDRALTHYPAGFSQIEPTVSMQHRAATLLG